VSWQLHIDDRTDGRVFPDWQRFEQALIADVKAGKVPAHSTIILRKAPKLALQRPQEAISTPVVLIPPPSYTVPRMRAQREEQAKRDLKAILYMIAGGTTLIATLAWSFYG
jgi:hypothetical protein